MTAGRVRGGFLDVWTRLVGPPLLPGPGPFNKQVFPLAPGPSPSGPVGPRGLRQPLQGIHGNAILKRKKSFPFKHKFINIDSQNHKHKLGFERGHKPQKKKKKNEPQKKLEILIHQGFISDLGLSLSQTTKIFDDRRWFQPSIPPLGRSLGLTLT